MNRRKILRIDRSSQRNAHSDLLLPLLLGRSKEVRGAATVRSVTGDLGRRPLSRFASGFAGVLSLTYHGSTTVSLVIPKSIHYVT